MTTTNCNTKPKTRKHLTEIQRGRLEEMAKSGTYTQTQMAKELGVHQSTISRELKRGRVMQKNSDHSTFHRYFGETGARVYRENRTRCHAKSYQEKYSTAFFEALVEAIVSTKKAPRKHSVDSFVHTYRKNHPDEKVPCTKTVYKLIDQGKLSIRNIHLPMKTRMRPRKKKSSEPKGKNIKRLGRSIEERDPSVLTREEFGHWELDLVLGKKKKDEPVIVTLVERKTRFLLTKKVWGRSAEKIQETVLQMMSQQGEEQFLSLTTDNGSEFSSLSLVEGQVSNLSMYFAHAFSSWEKGTNECHNRMLREFIPKGTSLKNLKYAELALYTEAINERPRRILGYDTPAERLMKELRCLSYAA